MNKARALLQYDDPANGLPVTEVIAEGEFLKAVEEAATRIHQAILLDQLGVGRIVSGPRIGFPAHVMRQLQIIVLDGENHVSLTLGITPDV